MTLKQQIEDIIDDVEADMRSSESATEDVLALFKEATEEVIGVDEQAVMGRGVPGYTRNLLRKEQRARRDEIV